jgi:hypothetical protein
VHEQRDEKKVHGGSADYAAAHEPGVYAQPVASTGIVADGDDHGHEAIVTEAIAYPQRQADRLRFFQQACDRVSGMASRGQVELIRFPYELDNAIQGALVDSIDFTGHVEGREVIVQRFQCRSGLLSFLLASVLMCSQSVLIGHTHRFEPEPRQ